MNILYSMRNHKLHEYQRTMVFFGRLNYLNIRILLFEVFSSSCDCTPCTNTRYKDVHLSSSCFPDFWSSCLIVNLHGKGQTSYACFQRKEHFVSSHCRSLIYTLGFEGFSNCWRMNESGVLAASSSAFLTAPFMPKIGSVSTNSAPKALRMILLSILIEAGMVRMSL